MSHQCNEIDPVEIDAAIQRLGERVKKLTQKLNSYIQKNGCSAELKRKAKTYLGGSEQTQTE